MASVTKSATSASWRVLWYEDGRKRQKNFKTKAEAKKFAALIELSPQAKQSRLTVADLLIEYRDHESVKKRGSRTEILRINRFLERAFSAQRLSAITHKDIQSYIEERMDEPSKKYEGNISTGTILKELTTLSAVFSYGVKKGLLEKNPCSGVDRPRAPEHRERVASEAEIQRLLVSAGWDGESVPATLVQLTMAAFLFACRTGMRSGEILRLEEAWIEGRVIHLPKEATKTESKRDVALSREAVKILDLVRARGDAPKIFGALTDQSRDTLWRKIRDRAELGPVFDSEGRQVKEGLNFHDSRATFATWAASPDPKTGAPRLDVLALARQTGHKNLKMLSRYYRASAAEIADRLDRGL